MENTELSKVLKKNYNLLYVVLGGSYEQLPLIYYLKKNYKEFKILTFDLYKKSPGSKISNYFFNIDIRDYKKIFSIIKDLNVVGISSIITEHSIKTINYLSKRLNLPSTSIDSVKATESKYFARKIFKEVFDEKIKYLRTDNYNSYLKFIKKNKINKFVLKPDISSGQRGLSLVDHKNRDKKKLFFDSKKFSLNKKVLIEEYITGDEINIVAIIKNNKIIRYIVSERCRYIKAGIGFGIVYRHSNPYKCNKSLKKKISKILTNMCKKIKIKNGIIFPQMIVKDNKVYLIEFSERVPGGLMNKVFENSTGIDLNKYQIDCSLGNLKKINYYYRFRRYKYVRIEFLNSYPGRLKIGKVKKIRNIKEILKMNNVIDANIFYSGQTKDYADISIKKLKFAKDRFFYFIYGSNKLIDFNKLHKKSLNKLKIVGNNNKLMLRSEN